MARIKVKELEPGMRLAEDVHDTNGRFLLGADCELEEKHIRALQAWGIISVQIVGENVEETAEQAVDPELLEQVRQEALGRFRFVSMDNSFMRELFNEAVRREAVKRSQGENR